MWKKEAFNVWKSLGGQTRAAFPNMTKNHGLKIIFILVKSGFISRRKDFCCSESGKCSAAAGQETECGGKQNGVR